MADIRQPIDWFRAISHGLFGLILGGMMGLTAWFKLIPEGVGNWGYLVVLGPAAVLGFCGACWGDDFWERWRR